MNWTEFFAAQLEREAPISKRAFEKVPEGRPDWKPHEKSMPLGYLSQLVATMPGWIAIAVQQYELDLNPPAGSTRKPPASIWRRSAGPMVRSALIVGALSVFGRWPARSTGRASMPVGTATAISP